MANCQSAQSAKMGILCKWAQGNGGEYIFQHLWIMDAEKGGRESGGPYQRRGLLVQMSGCQSEALSTLQMTNKESPRRFYLV